MTAEFSYGLARPEEEPQLRALLARNPVPGLIEVTYCREPDYYLGCQVMGDRVQVGVCRRNGREIVGIAQRSSRLMFVNGAAERVGYLSQLRLDQPYWGQGLTREGFRYGRKLHAAGDVRGYITTIIELNRRARAILETPREPFPHYHDIGRVYTLALIVRRPRPTADEVQISRGADLAEIVSFLNREGARRQFFYRYEVADFSSGRLFGFSLDDLFVARRGGEIIGLLGYWNQAHFKQTVISGYHPAIGLIKPFYNSYLRLIGGRPLPPAGQRLSHGYAALTCVRADEAPVFAALLQRVVNLAQERGDGYLMIGLHEADPLLPIARALPHVAYRSRLYAVTWEEDETFYDQLDQRVPHIEIATL